VTRWTRTRGNVARAGAICAALALALTGCGSEDPDEGTNGVGRLPAATIEKKARAAVGTAEAVRLSGTVVSKGRTYRLEMRLKKSGGIGEVAARGGDTFQLLRLEKDLFLKAGTDFWAHQEQGAKGDPSEADMAAARKLEGKYVKVPQDDPAYAQLSGFTEMDVLLDGLLVLDGERETGDHTDVDGAPAIQVRAAGGQGGTLDVALDGTPFPLRISRGGDTGTVELHDWNKGFALHAPEEGQVVDYGKEISADGAEG
jgi:hypothetical protein